MQQYVIIKKVYCGSCHEFKLNKKYMITNGYVFNENNRSYTLAQLSKKSCIEYVLHDEKQYASMTLGEFIKK